MDTSLPQLLYLLATALFILGIKRLSKVKTARSGNGLAALGMLLAIVVTLAAPGAVEIEGVLRPIKLSWQMILVGLAIGAGIGALMAKRIQMTGMPELVALLNGVGGLASTFVALSEFWGRDFGADVTSQNVILGGNV